MYLAMGAAIIAVLIILKGTKPSVRPGGIILVGTGRPRESFPWVTLLVLGGGLFYAWSHWHTVNSGYSQPQIQSSPRYYPAPRHDAFRSYGRS